MTAFLTTDFVQRALLAGSAVAVLSGLVGYFVVLRAQVFASDALSHTAYAGALAALAAGVDLRFGLFAACIAVGLALGLLGGRRPADDVVIGTTFAWILGLGVLFVALYTQHSSTANGNANVTVLFGSMFGLNASTVRTAVIVAALGVVVLLLIARPLLFASLDPVVAAARGVPVRLLGAGFLALVGVTAAEASQAVGALLLFALLAAPPAAAQLLTDRPWRGLVLSAVLAVAIVWIGIVVAYAAPALPVSFIVMATATVGYLGAAGVSAVRTARRRASGRRVHPSRPPARGSATPAPDRRTRTAA